MSYARFGWDGSDVYVYETRWKDGTAWECCACFLSPRSPDRPLGRSHFTFTGAAMLGHLVAHRYAGHCVPDDAFTDLAADLLADRLEASRG